MDTEEIILNNAYEYPYYYVKGEKFAPVVASSLDEFKPETHNVVVLKPCFERLLKNPEAEVEHFKERLESLQTKVIWAIDPCSWEDFFSSLLPGRRQIQVARIEKVVSEFIVPLSKWTFGLLLFEDAIVPLSSSWPTQISNHYPIWLEKVCEKGSSSLEDQFLKSLFILPMLSEYIHELGAALPYDILAFSKFEEVSTFGKAELFYLLSKRNFPHIHLISDGYTAIPGLFHYSDESKGYVAVQSETHTIGLCLPEVDKLHSEGVFAQVKQTVSKLADSEISFRAIEEFMLTESWEGLDDIIFLESGLGPQGTRILQGFAVTGGRLVAVDRKIEVGDEITLKEFLEENRGRGI